jgi:NADH-quinone oxidoreductase subunit J
MILFLFIIALLGAKKESKENTFQKYMAASFVFLIFGELLLALTAGSTHAIKGNFTHELIAGVGSAKVIGVELFTRYLVPFELASCILLVATVGIICLAKFPTRPQRRPVDGR